MLLEWGDLLDIVAMYFILIEIVFIIVAMYFQVRNSG